MSSSTSSEVFEEVFQMWKAIVDAVIESFAYADPMVYMYYITAKREGELQAEAAPSEASRDRAVELRLVKASRLPQEARA